MTARLPDVTTLYWRAAWLSVLAAMISLVGIAPSILAGDLHFAWVLTGLLFSLSGIQVHFAIKGTRTLAPNRFRPWMRYLRIALYALGLVLVGFGVIARTTVAATT